VYGLSRIPPPHVGCSQGKSDEIAAHCKGAERTHAQLRALTAGAVSRADLDAVRDDALQRATALEAKQDAAQRSTLAAVRVCG
jgi:hypothetical protein